MAVAHDISRMLDWVGISSTATGYIDFQSALLYAGVEVPRELHQVTGRGPISSGGKKRLARRLSCKLLNSVLGPGCSASSGRWSNAYLAVAGARGMIDKGDGIFNK
jgi:hypothetical protein